MKTIKTAYLLFFVLGVFVLACTDDEEEILKADNPLYPIDNQQNWVEQASPDTDGYYEVFFLDDQHGWAVGFDVIVSTNNGGITWAEQEYDPYIVPSSVHFTDESNGWIVGNEGTFLKTTDGGTNWVSLQTTNQVSYSTVFFINQDIGWVADSDGVVLKTENGGESWSSYEVGTLYPLEDLQFLDHQTGWVVGYGGGIFKTTDGGLNWVLQETDLDVPGYEPDYEDVHFVDNQTGWVSGVYFDFDDNNSVISYHFLLKTDDSGQTWKTQLTDTVNTFEEIFFLDEQAGWISLSEKKRGTSCIIQTTDGGENWTRSAFVNERPLNSIYFVDKQNGWAVEDRGRIFRFQTK
jgi:photosystem II stability/assembly factor-like uncharacterized protein